MKNQRKIDSRIQPVLRYICPFSEQDQRKCVEKYIETADTLRKNLFDIEAESDPEVYMKLFEESSDLKGLAKVPFSLNLMINIFPQLKRI